MSADGHGLPDNAIRGAHDMIHHAEQEEHEHEAATKRGLTDQAVEAEYDFMHHAEDELAKLEVCRSTTDSLNHPRILIRHRKTKAAGSRRKWRRCCQDIIEKEWTEKGGEERFPARVMTLAFD